MSENAKGVVAWIVILTVLAGLWFVFAREKKAASAPTPQPEKPMWTLERYDSGLFYFKKNVLTEIRAVCEPGGDCVGLLDKVDVGFLGELDNVKKDGLHLAVTQKGSTYYFRIEAMGRQVEREPNGEDSN